MITIEKRKKKVNYFVLILGFISCMTIIGFFWGIPMISDALGRQSFDEWYGGEL